MKIDIGSYSTVEVESTETQQEFKLAKGSENIIFQIFSKKIYSNPIGSIVREITSNCFDSHTEAGINVPVLIKKTASDVPGKVFISFIDFGVGMSPNRITNTFTTYFESTKRDTDKEIGGFGLGAKTPLAYKRYDGDNYGDYDNSYFIITCFDGIKYTYVIHEGKSAPQITLLTEEPTTQRNGTEVKIPVLERDRLTFEKELRNQLYYFENIVFEGFSDVYVSNTYTIHEGNHFYYRGSNYSSNIHISLGRVAYPIDYNVLNISPISLPIALKFDIGDLDVIISREGIDYTSDTIKKIKEKLELVKKELRERLIYQNENIVTLEDYLEKDGNFYPLYLTSTDVLNLSEIVTSVELNNFKYKSVIKKKSYVSVLDLLIDKKMFGKKEPVYSWRSNKSEIYSGGYGNLRNSKCLYHHNDSFVRVVSKQSYLKDIHPRYYILTKSNIDEVVKNNLFFQDFGPLLNELQDDYFDLVKKYTPDYEKIEVPKNHKKRDKKYSGIDLNATIPIKLYIERHSYTIPTRITFSVLKNFNCCIFYGFRDDDRLLGDSAADFKATFSSNIEHGLPRKNDIVSGKNKKQILFVQISKQNEVFFKQLKNAHHVKHFKTIMLRRKFDIIAKKLTIRDIVNRFNNIPRFMRREGLSQISENLLEMVNNVQKYVEKTTKQSSAVVLNDNLIFRHGIVKSNDAEDKKILRDMEKLELFVTKNQEMLQYVRDGWDIDYNINSSFWICLNKLISL